MTMKSIIDIHISREELLAMTTEEREAWFIMVLDSMTPEQLVQMARIGKRVIMDDIFQRAEKRPRTALRTMAMAVNVTVNEVKTGAINDDEVLPY